MVENLIMFLIVLCLLVAAVYLVQWVLGRLGIDIPPMVMNIIWVIVVLVALLLLWRAFGPLISGGRLLR